MSYIVQAVGGELDFMMVVGAVEERAGIHWEMANVAASTTALAILVCPKCLTCLLYLLRVASKGRYTKGSEQHLQFTQQS
jgi:hypothetical protein